MQYWETLTTANANAGSRAAQRRHHWHELYKQLKRVENATHKASSGQELIDYHQPTPSSTTTPVNYRCCTRHSDADFQVDLMGTGSWTSSNWFPAALQRLTKRRKRERGEGEGISPSLLGRT